MHDGGALSQVGAQAHAVCVTNADAGRHNVVHHAGELVHGVNNDRAAGGQAAAHHLEIGHGARTVVGPDHIIEEAEDTVHIQTVWLDCAVGQEVQAQVSIVGIDGGVIQILDGGLNGNAGYATLLVRACQRGELLGDLLQALGFGGLYVLIGVYGREPYVQDGAVMGDGC